jgi:nicotinate-nucleotide adenylyltransferase
LENLKNFKKVAIMGGTFDPVHLGHLHAAQYAREEFGIEKVLFMPAGLPPHKDNICLSDAAHRFNMVALSVKGNRYFGVSDFEILSRDTTYSIDTVKEIKSHMQDGAVLYFIIGADTAPFVKTWKSHTELEQLVTFIVVSRRGNEVKRNILKNCEILNAPVLEISSTEIRARIKEGKSVKYTVTDAAQNYIRDNALYGFYSSLYPKITRHLKTVLSERKFTHTLGVEKEAVRLCQMFGGNEEKARVAALLHDAAKNMPSDEKLAACKKYGIKLDSVLKSQPNLTHQFIGAKIAEDLFGITDSEILNAIKYHTTGRKNMSHLEKIIFVADCTEPYRSDYDGLAEIRAAAKESLDRAILVAIKFSIEYVKAKGQPLHPLSLEALEFTIQEGK